MRIIEVGVGQYKGLDVQLPWASAVVLFGPNDSGKTNTLEAFLSTMGGNRSVRGGEAAELVLGIELNGLDVPDHPDQRTFASWLLDEDTEWLPWDDDLDYVDGGDHTAMRSLHDSLSSLKSRYAEWQRDYLPSPSETPELVSALLELAGRHWDLRRDEGEIPREPGVPASGEGAVSSRIFVVRPHGLSWWSSDGTPIVDCSASKDYGSFLDALNVRVIRVEATADSLHAMYEQLEATICRLAQELDHLDTDDAATMEDDLRERLERRRRHPWTQRREGLTIPRTSVAAACEAFGAYVTRLAPRFVSASYDIAIRPDHPDEWEHHDGRHLTVCLSPHVSPHAFEIGLASSGIATWTGFALSEALRLAAEGSADLDLPKHPRDPSTLHQRMLEMADRLLPHSQSFEPPTIYVFDEPEAHLHPLAQEQAAEWIAERASAGAHVLLATHSVPFLRLPLEDVEYLMVTRTADWQTKAVRITDDTLGAVASSAEAMGLPPVALIQLTLAWLLVEGEHDRRIIEAFFGQELRRAGIQILPLRGAARAKASFTQIEALKRLGTPFFCLLDNTYAGRLEEEATGVPRTEEEFIAEQLRHLAGEEGVDLKMLSWPYPDIICALPIEAMRSLALECNRTPGTATSWDDFVEHYRQRKLEAEESGRRALDFKAFVLQALSLSGRSADWLVTETLRRCDQRPPDGSPLRPLVSGMVASVEAAAHASVDSTSA